MPHYVNIAWGFIFWRVFLLVGRDGSLDFAFYLKNQTIIKKQNTMCRMSGGYKKHDEK